MGNWSQRCLTPDVSVKTHHALRFVCLEAKANRNFTLTTKYLVTFSQKFRENSLKTNKSHKIFSRLIKSHISPFFVSDDHKMHSIDNDLNHSSLRTCYLRRWASNSRHVFNNRNVHTKVNHYAQKSRKLITSKKMFFFLICANSWCEDRRCKK